MNMLAEDMDHVFRPTPLPTDTSKITTVASTVDEPKGRALNFSMDEHHVGNILSNSSADHHHHHTDHDDFDLSDVTIGDDDEDMDMLTSKILAPKMESKNTSFGKRK